MPKSPELSETAPEPLRITPEYCQVIWGRLPPEAKTMCTHAAVYMRPQLDEDRDYVTFWSVSALRGMFYCFGIKVDVDEWLENLTEVGLAVEYADGASACAGEIEYLTKRRAIIADPEIIKLIDERIGWLKSNAGYYDRYDKDKQYKFPLEFIQFLEANYFNEFGFPLRFDQPSYEK